jgi:GT2 family glycosyltransferase
VDDGGQDGTQKILGQPLPYRLRYFWQTNQGDAAARDCGVRESQAEIIVSLDDDMILEKDYLKSLADELKGEEKKIVTGSWYLWVEDEHPLTVENRFMKISRSDANVAIPFVEINTHSLAIRREDYLSLGMMHDLGFPGSRMWTDVDLAYRAFLQGYQFIRVGKAIIWHRDYVFKNLENHKKRMYTAGYRSVVLFKRHPDLIRHLPMFDDKTPIQWKHDAPKLFFRKIARRWASGHPVLWVLEQFYKMMQGKKTTSPLLEMLERWIVGGNIYRGYHQGLREFK